MNSEKELLVVSMISNRVFIQWMFHSLHYSKSRAKSQWFGVFFWYITDGQTLCSFSQKNQSNHCSSFGRIKTSLSFVSSKETKPTTFGVKGGETSGAASFRRESRNSSFLVVCGVTARWAGAVTSPRLSRKDSFSLLGSVQMPQTP